MYDVEQWLNQRASSRDSGGSDPQPALVPHVQRRRHLDARQVGVSLVRRLGSRLPRRVPGVRRSGLRPRAARADAARSLSASERAAAGLRVELRRRQPAGPRLGDLFNYRLNRESMGDDAIPFLKRTFHMLVSNFTWWLNRKDREGRNLFEGGFLGLDNIGVFDRSAPLPTGGFLEQADGTAWMAFYAQNMLDMALELALVDPAYEPLAVKFYEHVVVDRRRREPQRRQRFDVGRGGRLLLRRPPRARAVHDPPQGEVDRGPAPAVRGLDLPPGGGQQAAGVHGAGEPGSTRTGPICWPTSISPDGPDRAAASCCPCSPRTSSGGC